MGIVIGYNMVYPYPKKKWDDFFSDPFSHGYRDGGIGFASPPSSLDDWDIGIESI